MTDFNYDQFPIPLLQAELSRIQEQSAILNERHELIVQALARKALEGVQDDTLLFI